MDGANISLPGDDSEPAGRHARSAARPAAPSSNGGLPRGPGPAHQAIVRPIHVSAQPLPLAQGPPAEPDPGTAVIQTTALTKRYPGAVTALDALTVRVEPGITGLVGANGAGKSTLIKILLGLLQPTSGQAWVLGGDCLRDAERIRTLTGYMPEHDCLPPDVTATEFVTHLGRMSGLPTTAAKERAAESLRHVGLYEERYRHIGTYSTGMKQRVKLAQALAGDPRLLLLDEPTNGLDPAGRAAMLDLVSRIGSEFGISVVVSSHLLGEFEQICDHLIAIDAGRLLRSATMSSFTKASQVLAVEVEEGSDLLAAELTARGLGTVRAERELLVLITGDATFDAVRDVVADLGLPLTRMEQRRHRVEELFRADASLAASAAGLMGAVDGH